MPSELESFGLAALEAMACKVPSIATRVGGVPELIDDGVTGLLFPVGDVDAMAAGGPEPSRRPLAPPGHARGRPPHGPKAILRQSRRPSIRPFLRAGARRSRRPGHEKFLKVVAKNAAGQHILLPQEVLYDNEEIGVSSGGMCPHAALGSGCRRPFRRHLDHKHGVRRERSHARLQVDIRQHHCKDSNFHGQHGEEDGPGYLVIDGPINPDGSAKLHAKGTVQAGKAGIVTEMKGNKYDYYIEAKFTDTSGTGKRDEGAGILGRPCTFRVHQADRSACGPAA